MSEDESEDSEEEEESQSEKGSDSQDEQDSEEEVVEIRDPASGVTVQDFLRMPTTENFLALGDDKADLILKEATVCNDLDLNWTILKLEIFFSEKF